MRQLVIPSTLLKPPRHRPRANKGQRSPTALTAQELAILQGVANGLRMPEIGAKLSITGHCAAVHLHHIRKKLEAATTGHAVAVALRRELIK